MIGQQNSADLLAEVTTFVEALDTEVLQEMCDELQAVQQDLGPRDQRLLEIALVRLAAISSHQEIPMSPNLSQAFERP